MRLLEKFHRPENWDSVADGPGYCLYAGGDDWHVSATSVWVVFPSDEGNRRIWFTIAFPQDCVWDDGAAGSRQSDNRDRCKKHTEKAWRTWLRTAREAHRSRNHGSRSWKDAFKSALQSKEMQAFIKERGEEQTQWGEIKESTAQVVQELLDDPAQFIHDFQPQRYFEVSIATGGIPDEQNDYVELANINDAALRGLDREAIQALVGARLCALGDPDLTHDPEDIVAVRELSVDEWNDLVAFWGTTPIDLNSP